jgi:hypothetical protein
LLLSICSLGLAGIYGARYCASTLAGYSVTVDLAIYTAAAAVVILSRTWIVFVLARRPMPLFFWIVIGLDGIRTTLVVCGAFLPLNWSLGLATTVERTYAASIYAGGRALRIDQDLRLRNSASRRMVPAFPCRTGHPFAV